MPAASDRPRSDGRQLSLTDAARGLRRQLGPTAWTVLEELLLDATGGEPMVVETHVRRIAEGVGISKDTAARAVRHLIAQGVVTRSSGRDPLRGCFGRSVYVLHLEGIGGVVLVAGRTVGEAGTRPKPRRSAPRRAHSIAGPQASLFDVPTGSTS
ncbi:MAG: hypothetical protein ACT452_08560 [Microthrixaceae bacterium]